MKFYRYRIFISYAHDDKAIVQQIADILQDLGMDPLWDHHLKPGNPFDQQIMEFIRNSHIFIPIITEKSHESKWVHQEIGFAFGIQIPILPLVIGKLPSDLIERLQALPVDNDLFDLKSKLSAIDYNSLVNTKTNPPRGMSLICNAPEERTLTLIEYTKKLLTENKFGHLRYRGGVGSFSIPDKHEYDPIWDRRDGFQRGDYARQLLRQERQLFERHAREKGISFIMNLDDKLNNRPWPAPITRWQLVHEFIKSMPSDKVKVACIKADYNIGELILIGDHFLAEATTLGRGGLTRTYFRLHPIDVYQAVVNFDSEFEEISGKVPTDKDSALEMISVKIEELKEEHSRQSDS